MKRGERKKVGQDPGNKKALRREMRQGGDRGKEEKCYSIREWEVPTSRALPGRL